MPRRPILAQSPAELYAPQAISGAGDAINVFDFHEVAKQVLLPGHYAYMAMGTDDGGTLRANRAGFEQFRLRMRRLVDVREIDMSMELFGESYPLPILIAPCGSQKAFHPEGRGRRGSGGADAWRGPDSLHGDFHGRGRS